MDKFLEALDISLIDFDCDSNILKNDLRKLICSKGKRIRPRLAYLTILAHNETISNSQMELISAVELLHTASLIHDDIIDDAETRRGEQVLHKKFTPQLAVIAGDLLASVAMNKIININNQDIQEKFNKTFQAMCNAEITQYFNKGEIPSLEEYLEKSKNKTGLLFGIILEGCAILSNKINPEKMYNFGLAFGTAFQIKNDLNSFLSENSEDKDNGIFTAPDIYLTAGDSTEISIEKTRTLIDNKKQEAIEIIQSLSDSVYKTKLKEMIEGI